MASLTEFSLSTPAASIYFSSIQGYVNISLNPHLKAKYCFNLCSNNTLFCKTACSNLIVSGLASKLSKLSNLAISPITSSFKDTSPVERHTGTTTW